MDASALAIDEITLIGSRCGPFDPALQLLEQKTIDPIDLISARYSLARAIEAPPFNFLNWRVAGRKR